MLTRQVHIQAWKQKATDSKLGLRRALRLQMGLAAQLKTGRRRAARAAEPALAGVAAYADWPDDDIIEL